MRKRQLITQDRDILGGKPIIAGTRMSVESVLELLSSGMETKTILKEYPFLNTEQIRAVIDYAKRVVSAEESYLFDKSHSLAHEISGRR